MAQPVRKFNGEVQDHVSPLVRAFGQGEALPDDPLLHPGFDDVSGGHSDGPAVQRRGVDRAAAQGLGEGWRTRLLDKYELHDTQ